MRSVTYAGLAGQDTFPLPFLATNAADVSVTVGGSAAGFTVAQDKIKLNAALVADAAVVVATVHEEGVEYDGLLPSNDVSVSAVPVSTASVQLVASNATRHKAGVSILNDSASANLLVRPGDTAASATDYAYKVAPGGSVLIERYRGAIQGIWDAADAAGHARISEYL